MESRHFLRFSFLFIGLTTLLLITWINLPYSPPKATDLFDCTSQSSWCTSKKRLNSYSYDTLRESHKSTRHHDSAVPHHPLDPLTIQEINRVRDILSSHALFKKSSSYALHSITLEEPDKPLVLNWKKGHPLLPRKASVVARVKNRSYVLTVDLTTGEVAVHSKDLTTSGYPTMTIEDMTSATWAPLSSSEFNRTILERGVDLKDLACLPISLGWFGEKEENRRLIKVQCYSMEDTANFYMRPIEGLTVLVDLDTLQVLEISDKGKNIPIPKAANTDYRYSVQGPNYHHQMDLTNPISIEQPKGLSFVIEDDHFVKWANRESK